MIPSLGKLPTSIERDASSTDIIRRLLAMGMLTPESSVTLDRRRAPYDLIDMGFRAMLGPVMAQFEDDYGDMINVGGDEDANLLRVTCLDHAIDELLPLGSVIDALEKASNVGRDAHLAEVKDFTLKPELPCLASSDLLRWFGWIIEHHDAFACPSCWPDRLQELNGGDETDDNNEPLPVANSAEIDAEIKRLKTAYPYLIDPDPFFHPDDQETDKDPDLRVPRACMPHEKARDQIAVVDPKLAAILYALAVAASTPGFRNDECFACVCISYGDRISDALERMQHNINNGYYDTSSNELFSIEAKLEELPAHFAKIDAWFRPVAQLKEWISHHGNRTVTNP